jgi:adenine deaminase
MKENNFKISGNIVDIINQRIYPGTVEVSGSHITNIIEEPDAKYDTFILPGFIDAHVHIESSMLVPSEFARMAVIHGTVATVSDPHEIANVMGTEGIHYMIENGNAVPFKFNFGASSCVPATSFETSGADIGIAGVEELLENIEIKYLSEMMNYPGVINGDPVVMGKIGAAIRLKKPIDGHAPGLRGEDLVKYVAAGISTDHECFEYDEALEKLELGMKIIIREGSAAINFEALYPFIDSHTDMVMLCSDDKHPDSLELGHINQLVKRAMDKGIDKMKALKCACVNPVLHYGLDVGLLRAGDAADFIVIDNFDEMNILKTYIDGKLVAESGNSFIERVPVNIINNFKAGKKNIKDFKINSGSEKIRVIEAIDGQLITNCIEGMAVKKDDNLISNLRDDVLKIAVVNRYEDAKPAIAFITNFNLKRGAIASSVAHDSHNIIAVGTNDEDICNAVNLLIANKGGLSLSDGDTQKVLPLPVAGLMSDKECHEAAKDYTELEKLAEGLGTKLGSAYMTLSFMALLVIPKLKLSDKGLFDGSRFEFVDVGVGV